MRRFIKQIFFFAGCLTLVYHVDVSASTFAHFWSKDFGDAAEQICYSVTTDAGGNVYITGSFVGTVNFGGGTLNSAGAGDVFVAKFNSAGVHQWSQRFGDGQGQVATSVTTDFSGSVIITGSFGGTVNFGGANLASAGSNDIFVAAFNGNGFHLWSQRFGDAAEQYGESVVTDGAGNITVAGRFFGSVNFGGGNLVSAGSSDIFVAKFNSAGVHQWSQRFGDVLDDDCPSVKTDGAGNAVATGYFKGTVNFGGGNLVSAGGSDIFVAKFDSFGIHQWSQRFGNASSSQVGRSIVTDGGGNVIVTGDFVGTVDFGGGPLISAGANDVFVAKFNSAGVHQWSQRFGAAGGQWSYALARDVSGNVVIAGIFETSIDFGGGVLVANPADLDMFVAKFSPAGVHQVSQRFGGLDLQLPYGAAMDGNGNAIVAGVFAGTINFGGGDFTSAGVNDIFVAKFGALAAEPAITSILDIGNDQGRRVKIRFNRSGIDDAAAAPHAVRYDAFRRDDPAPAAGASQVAMRVSSLEPRVDGWTQVGSVSAYGDNSYGIDVPTVGDSTIALGSYYSSFMVRAATALPTVFYDSPPDSGYSLDNLAPGVPGGFAYSTGQLTWDESTTEDFDYFSVYGSNTNSFGSATLIDYTVTPGMDVTASPYTFYFATATDFSGNEGRPAVVNTLSGVGETPESYVLSISSYPNPFNPETTIRYTLPSKGRVTIAVYDARGAFVATLVNEDKNAGAYTKAWNGTDANGGTVGSGVYFARVSHASGTRSYKMVLLK